MKRVFAVAGLMVLCSAPAGASDPVYPAGAACRTSATLVGQCFTIHGRLSAYNGNPTFRIWRVGTQRLLGVLDSAGLDPEDASQAMPAPVQSLLQSDVMGVPVYGDFEVCPLTAERPGKMQMVCLAGADHLTVRRP